MRSTCLGSVVRVSLAQLANGEPASLPPCPESTTMPLDPPAPIAPPAPLPGPAPLDEPTVPVESPLLVCGERWRASIELLPHAARQAARQTRPETRAP